MLHTTFAKAHDADACVESYRKMGKALGGIKKYGRTKPIPLTKVLEVCGLDDALWCLPHCIEQGQAERIARLFACDCAERVLPLFEKERPGDDRPRAAILVARAYANGEATIERLDAAGDAARAAARAAWAAERGWQERRFLQYLNGEVKLKKLGKVAA